MADRVVCLYDFSPDEFVSLFAHRDAELVLLDGSEEPSARRAVLAGATVVISSLHRSHPLTAADLAVMEACRVVQASAAGFDSVDHVAAAERGIPVANLRGFNVDAVADWTLTGLLWLLRRPDRAHAGIESGEWAAAAQLGRDLAELTVGIVGFGRIGRAVATRVAAFGATVVVHDVQPVDTAYEQLGLTELLGRCDVVSMHLPLDTSTRGLLDAHRLAQLRPGALLLNAGRGGIIDEHALAAALDAGQAGGAALDVFEREPLEPESPLRGRSDVLLSPHCAGLTRAAAEGMRRDLVAAVDHVLDGGAPRNVVNGVTGRERAVA